MLTYAVHKDAKRLETYFDEHLDKGEYYTEKDVIDGTWFGRTTEQFSFQAGSSVDKDAFKSLCNGVHPDSKGSLTPRDKSNRIAAYDMVFSAPKSVSILAVTVGDERLLKAHQESVAATIAEIENYAKTRVRKLLPSSSKLSRPTHNLLGASFTHKTSRLLDPQLHTHCVVFNATYDPVEKRLKALDAVDMLGKSSVGYFTELYRSVLARKVQEIGYDIVEGSKTWKIKGVSEEVETLFSKRSQDIKDAVIQLEAIGVKVSTRGKALIALNTRKKKQREIAHDEVVELQKKQLPKTDIRTLNQLKDSTIARPLPPLTPQELAKLTQLTSEHLFERKSVAKKTELLREILLNGRGRVSQQQAEQELKRICFVQRGNEIISKEERRREIGLLASVREGIGTFPSLVKNTPKFESATPLQKKALLKLCSSRDQIMMLRGAAGVGKTFALRLLHEAINFDSIHTAPTSGATEKLRNDGFKNAITLQKLLGSESYISEKKCPLIIVDEAGLVSTRQMEKLFTLAKTNKTRILLVGDTRQHNSVEAGDALRLLEDFSLISRASIDIVTRQQSAEYRKAVQLFSDGHPVKGFKKLRAMGVVHGVKGTERHLKVAKEYASNLKSRITTLVVTPTWEEHAHVTNAVREELRKNGHLGDKQHQISTHQSLNYTSSQKKMPRSFEIGMTVAFYKNSHDFKAGENWRVSKRTSKTVELKLGRRKALLPLKNSASYDVLVSKTISLSIGDKILLKGNCYTNEKQKLSNGSIHEIAKINSDRSLLLSSGKTIPANFKQFTHGYAVTSYSAQGKDAEHVIVSADHPEKGAISKNQAYVSFSRGKSKISVYAEDIRALEKALKFSSSRRLALDRLVRGGILKERIKRVKLNYEASIMLSKRLIERAFSKKRSKAKGKMAEPLSRYYL